MLTPGRLSAPELVEGHLARVVGGDELVAHLTNAVEPFLRAEEIPRPARPVARIANDVACSNRRQEPVERRPDPGVEEVDRGEDLAEAEAAVAVHAPREGVRRA